MPMAGVRILQRLGRDLSSVSAFATLSDYRRWLTVAYWQRFTVGLTDPLAPVPIRFAGWPHAFWLRPGSHDFGVVAEVFLGTEYAYLTEIPLPPQPTVLDLGGNIGTFARLVLRQWPEAHLTCVEASPSNGDVLRRNLAHSTATVISAAIGPAPGVVYLDTTFGESRIRTNATSGQAVRVVTVPSVMTGTGRIDLLKCDIEGAEAALFSDCGSWIHRVSHLVIETHPQYGYGLSDLERDLARAGVRFTRHHTVHDETAWYSLTAPPA